MPDPHKGSRPDLIWKWLTRAILTLVIMLVVLAVAGAVYEAIGRWRDAQRFHQRGRSVSIGRIKLNLNCTGEARPALILDSGLGGSALDWALVQPGLSKFARVCSYDRAGYGWSDLSQDPRTSIQIAKELKALLTAAAERPPYILVGHSFGGYNIRLFNKLYPGDVAGMVLVDSEHPDEDARLKEWENTLPAPTKSQIAANDASLEFWNRIWDPVKLHLGLDRLKVSFGRSRSPNLSKDLAEEFRFLEQRPNFIKATEDENALDSESAKQVRQAGDLGNRPLIVLTAGNPYSLDSDNALLSPQQRRARDDIWIDQLQAEYVRLSSRGKQIVVQGSGHDMPTDRPDAIIGAVHDVWNLAKDRLSTADRQ